MKHPTVLLFAVIFRRVPLLLPDGDAQRSTIYLLSSLVFSSQGSAVASALDGGRRSRDWDFGYERLRRSRHSPSTQLARFRCPTRFPVCHHQRFVVSTKQIAPIALSVCTLGRFEHGGSYLPAFSVSLIDHLHCFFDVTCMLQCIYSIYPYLLFCVLVVLILNPTKETTKEVFSFTILFVCIAVSLSFFPSAFSF